MLRKSVRLFGLALLGWAITDRGASAEAPLVISDGVSVALVSSADAWQLVLMEAGSAQRQERLLPHHHPLSPQSVAGLSLRQEVGGLTLKASYTVPNFRLSYELSFRYEPPTPTRTCALHLQRFRSEQRYQRSGVMRSGMVADYQQGLAQPLALEGVSSTTSLRPIRLLAQDTCWLALPAVFEFSPKLAVLRVH